MGILENVLPDHVLFTQLDKAINWARESSISYLTMDLACCGIEMAQVGGGRFDIERFGATDQVSPNHADLMIVAGTITHKMAPVLRKLYDQMPQPRYVIAMGSCASSGGLFSWEYSYSTVSGAEKLIPVDIFVPGCPPRPEALLHGLLTLQRRIRGERILTRSSFDTVEGAEEDVMTPTPEQPGGIDATP